MNGAAADIDTGIGKRLSNGFVCVAERAQAPNLVGERERLSGLAPWR
jgi:hypothetical protein